MIGQISACTSFELEMWANAQRDGRPAEHRWRPLFNAAVWLCSNAAKTRNPLKFAGCPKLTKRSQPLVGRSSPYCKDMWGRYCWLTSFFSDCRYVPNLQRCSPTKLCDGAQMAIFLHHFCVLYFQRAACSTFQTCILNSH